MTAELADGTELAGFRIEALLGRGGMASVYLAHDLRLGRRVALKVMSPALAGNGQFRSRFHRESRLLASLDHPNIVPVYQAGEANGLLYIAMRYVEGSDLNGLLDRDGRLPAPSATSVLTQVAAALQAAHDAGLVHRDVKPGNVLVTSGSSRQAAGRVYLTDFGLTKQLSSLSNLTAVGNVMGTLQYLAPEQISGRPVDARSDIYALGGLAYRCLTGEAPFEHEDQAALLWAHLSQAVRPVSELAPDLPEEVDDVIWTAMAKQPEDRFPSAAAFAEALAAALGPGPAPVVEATAVPAQPTAWREAAEPGAAPAASPQPPPRVAMHRRPALAGARTPGSPDGHGTDGAPQRARSGRGPGRVLAVGAVLLASLAGGAVLYTTMSSEELALDQHYEAHDSAPFAVDVPRGWEASDTEGTSATYSPRGEQLYALTQSRGSTGAWATLWDEVERDPDAVIGLWSSFLTGATYDLRDQPESFSQLLPRNATLSGDAAQTTVDGRPAQVQRGQLVNPDDERQELRFVAYVVQGPVADASMVHLVFLAPPAEFAEHREDFERIVDTVDFP